MHWVYYKVCFLCFILNVFHSQTLRLYVSKTFSIDALLPL